MTKLPYGKKKRKPQWTNITLEWLIFKTKEHPFKYGKVHFSEGIEGINIVHLKIFSLHGEEKLTIDGFEFTMAVVEGRLTLTAAFLILEQ